MVIEYDEWLERSLDPRVAPSPASEPKALPAPLTLKGIDSMAEHWEELSPRSTLWIGTSGRRS